MEYTTDRRAILSAVSTASLAAIAGCTGGADNGDDTFRLSDSWFPETLDPFDSGWTTQDLGILESVFRVDENSGVESRLITDWSLSDDSRTWTFELREDVTFHDGSKMDAAAIAFSLERTFSDPQSRLGGLPIESVDEVDEETVAITTSEPYALLPGQLSRPRAGIISPNSIAEDGTIEHLISTGPYTLESWDPNDQLILTSHNEYYGTTPTINKAIFEQVSDVQTRTLKLQNGELHIAQNLPNTAAEKLRTGSETELYLNEGVTDRIAVFNTEQEPLNDRRVRQALLYAIDKESIAEFVLNGVDEPAYGLWDSSSIDWANEDIKTYTYKPDRAESLLAEVGWERDGNDEIRRRDGNSLQVELWAYPEQPNLPDIAEAMQAQLAEVGFNINVRVTEWSALDEAKSNGEYDMFIGVWGMYGTPPDPGILERYYHPDGGGNLDHQYENPELTELIEAGRRTFDEEQRREIYDEAQKIAMEDVPFAVLTRKTEVNGTRTNVNGYDPNPHAFEMGLEELSSSEE